MGYERPVNRRSTSKIVPAVPLAPKFEFVGQMPLRRSYGQELLSYIGGLFRSTAKGSLHYSYSILCSSSFSLLYNCTVAHIFMHPKRDLVFNERDFGLILHRFMVQ